MKISQEVREFARLKKAEAAKTAPATIEIKQVFDEKSQAFRQGGGELYS
jgi:hypothetical protein